MVTLNARRVVRVLVGFMCLRTRRARVCECGLRAFAHVKVGTGVGADLLETSKRTRFRENHAEETEER